MTKTSRTKPNKPYPSFPLTAHPNGQWCKKILGSVHFFGVWADPDAALAHYHKVAADLHAGREPAPVADRELTVKDLCNHYLAYQMGRVLTGQIGPRWFEDCRRVLKHFASKVGAARSVASLAAEDFQRYRRLLVIRGLRGKSLGVHVMTRTLTVVIGTFKWGIETGLIDDMPRWGKALAKPSAADVRRSRAKRERENGKKLFSAEQIRALLDAAKADVKAAILLGINGGFGNTDCALLPRAAVDLAHAVIEFERPKTAVRRVVPLWPETISALRAVLEADRPKAANKAAEPLVFRSELGFPLVRQVIKSTEKDEIRKVTYIDRLGDWFDDLLVERGLKRFGLGFYALRHTFRTWADEIGDQHAIHVVMGHAIPGMSGIYVEEIGVERLRKVVNHVRNKLWPKRAAGTAAPGDVKQPSADEVNARA